MRATIYIGNVMKRLRELPDEGVQCVVTSPPYWGLRDYQTPGQLGLEKTPEEYIGRMVEVFREVRRVLRGDGVLFLNLGDSYFGGGRGGGGSFSSERPGWREVPYGISGKAPANSPSRDCLCGSLCDACRMAYQIGKTHSGSPPAPTPKPSLYAPSHEHRESENVHSPTSDSSTHESHISDARQDRQPMPELLSCEPRAAQWSTICESLPPLQGDSLRLAQPSLCQLCGCSLPDYAPGSAHKVECNCDNGPLVSDSRSQDKDVSDWAYPYSTTASLKPKDLCGIPWMLAFALCADGWYLRQDIIWSKPNPMPESVTDRCTKAHEYLFLLTKSARYYFDQAAIAEEATCNRERGTATYAQVPGGGDNSGLSRLSRSGNKERKPASARGVPVDTDGSTNGAVAGSVPWEGATRNKRSVWEIATQPFVEAHFATFPEKLVEPCILAGSRGARLDLCVLPEGEGEGKILPGDTILDPFCGSGTVGVVALRYHRDFVGIELNPEYAEMAERRIGGEIPLFAGVEVVRPKLAAVAGD